MGSSGDVVVEVGDPRREVSKFERVLYQPAIVNASIALINGRIRVRLQWLYGDLRRMLIEEEDEVRTLEVLGLKKCELTSGPMP